MPDYFENISLTESSARFGMKAMDMGFVSLDQVLEAMSEQVMDNYTSKCHRRLGRIFLEKGWMTGEQIDMVLKVLSEDREKKIKAAL